MEQTEIKNLVDNLLSKKDGYGVDGEINSSSKMTFWLKGDKFFNFELEFEGEYVNILLIQIIAGKTYQMAFCNYLKSSVEVALAMQYLTQTYL